MKIADRNSPNPEKIKGPSTRPAKKNLSKQEIRDMVSTNKKNKDKGLVEGGETLRNPRSPQNIERLKGALSDGTISFSPQERAILEKLLNP